MNFIGYQWQYPYFFIVYEIFAQNFHIFFCEKKINI